MGRKSILPGAAEDSVLCYFTPTPRRVTVSAQAWLVWGCSAKVLGRAFKTNLLSLSPQTLPVGVFWTQNLCWLFFLGCSVYWFVHLQLRPPLFFSLENPWLWRIRKTPCYEGHWRNPQCFFGALVGITDLDITNSRRSKMQITLSPAISNYSAQQKTKGSERWGKIYKGRCGNILFPLAQLWICDVHSCVLFFTVWTAVSIAQVPCILFPPKILASAGCFWLSFPQRYMYFYDNKIKKEKLKEAMCLCTGICVWQSVSKIVFPFPF